MTLLPPINLVNMKSDKENKDSLNASLTPGSVNGKITRRKVCQLLAPVPTGVDKRG